MRQGVSLQMTSEFLIFDLNIAPAQRIRLAGHWLHLLSSHLCLRSRSLTMPAFQDQRQRRSRSFRRIQVSLAEIRPRTSLCPRSVAQEATSQLTSTTLQLSALAWQSIRSSSSYQPLARPHDPRSGLRSNGCVGAGTSRSSLTFP